MKTKWDTLLNLLAFLLLLLLSAGFETSFWPHIFSGMPSPMLWLLIIIYIALYKKPFYALFMIYLFSFILTFFSLAPFKMLLIPACLLFGLIHIIKSRIFWSGPNYFFLMALFSNFIYQITVWGFSFWMEPLPANVDFWNRALCILLTMIFFFIYYQLMSSIDRWTKSEFLQESGGIEL